MYYDYRSYLNSIISILQNIFNKIEEYFPNFANHMDKIFLIVEIILVLVAIDRFINLGRRK